ncbi:hypothetical protein LVD15_22175 [Fulvivirga maritima]|uniref:hypothetical protein n=1 Tax=Fulvivirga maritima TaxID=2904247 RepID=UPI001F355F43|nr:hypothetical protein [Fulvivirga maritima]UII25982.1 hypothetical protein LVD15_22175 [Fulvivirga maritima]
MFITNIIKAIPFVIQIIIVIAAVVLFAYLDPFNLMEAKPKLKNTPVDVQSIKDIGELITAEYYGEVVSSYVHELNELYTEEIEQMTSEISELHADFVTTIQWLKNAYSTDAFRRTKAYDEFVESMGDSLLSSQQYEVYINYVYRRLTGKQYKSKHLDDQLSSRRHKKLIKELITDKNEESYNALKKANFIDNLIATYDVELKKEGKTKRRNTNLVMLGRGWVKAGFNFVDFNNDNFRYISETKRLYVIGLQPQIISATINPWFIPEKGVEGFEFLIVERKVKRDYKVVQMVKQRCLDELVRKANEREILTKALENAKVSLKAFFSLILDDDVVSVEFYDNELEYTANNILADSVLTGEELILIHHLFRKKEISGVQSENMEKAKREFLNHITGRNKLYPKPKIVIDQTTFETWSPELALQYEITKDGIYDQITDSLRIVEYSRYYSQFTDDSLYNVCDQAKIKNSYNYILDHTQSYYGYDTSLANDSTKLPERVEKLPYTWIVDSDDNKVGYEVPINQNGVSLGSLMTLKEYQSIWQCEP